MSCFVDITYEMSSKQPVRTTIRVGYTEDVIGRAKRSRNEWGKNKITTSRTESQRRVEAE